MEDAVASCSFCSVTTGTKRAGIIRILPPGWWRISGSLAGHSGARSLYVYTSLGTLGRKLQDPAIRAVSCPDCVEKLKPLCTRAREDNLFAPCVVCGAPDSYYVVHIHKCRNTCLNAKCRKAAEAIEAMEALADGI